MAGLTSKGRATRERIVAAAALLMFERGVAGTSTEDVQAAADVSASQLYHYFTDKRELVSAVIAFSTEAVLDAQAPVLTGLDSLAGLRKWRDLVVAMQRERGCIGGCPIGSLVVELVESDDAARIDLSDSFRRWAAALRAGLDAMAERGDFVPGADPARLATALLAALQGGLLLAQVHRDAAPLEDALDTVLDRIGSLLTQRQT